MLGLSRLILHSHEEVFMDMSEDLQSTPIVSGRSSPLSFFEQFYLVLVKLDKNILILLVVFHFTSSWILMREFEEGDNVISQMSEFWWYYIVTSTTVGYGDIFPKTFGGRIAGVYVMLGGIGFFATLLSKIANAVFEISRKAYTGMAQLDANGHIVIAGYHSERTEELVRELMLGDRAGIRIVVISDMVTENPFTNSTVRFVYGRLTSAEALNRACISSAAKILIHGKDDPETLSAGIAIQKIASQKAHIIAYFQHEESARLLDTVNERIECLPSLAVTSLAREVQDPHVMSIVTGLLSNKMDGNFLQLQVPNHVRDLKFGDLLLKFREQYGVLLIAIKDPKVRSLPNLIPTDETTIRAGMYLFYIGREHIAPDWHSFQ